MLTGKDDKVCIWKDFPLKDSPNTQLGSSYNIPIIVTLPETESQSQSDANNGKHHFFIKSEILETLHFRLLNLACKECRIQ